MDDEAFLLYLIITNVVKNNEWLYKCIKLFSRKTQ